MSAIVISKSLSIPIVILGMTIVIINFIYFDIATVKYVVINNIFGCCVMAVGVDIWRKSEYIKIHLSMIVILTIIVTHMLWLDASKPRDAIVTISWFLHMTSYLIMLLIIFIIGTMSAKPGDIKNKLLKSVNMTMALTIISIIFIIQNTNIVKSHTQWLRFGMLMLLIQSGCYLITIISLEYLFVNKIRNYTFVHKSYIFIAMNLNYKYPLSLLIETIVYFMFPMYITFNVMIFITFSHLILFTVLLIIMSLSGLFTSLDMITNMTLRGVRRLTSLEEE
jgi:hypothetical protein